MVQYSTKKMPSQTTKLSRNICCCSYVFSTTHRPMKVLKQHSTHTILSLPLKICNLLPSIMEYKKFETPRDYEIS